VGYIPNRTGEAYLGGEGGDLGRVGERDLAGLLEDLEVELLGGLGGLGCGGEHLEVWSGHRKREGELCQRQQPLLAYTVPCGRDRAGALSPHEPAAAAAAAAVRV